MRTALEGHAVCAWSAGAAQRPIANAAIHIRRNDEWWGMAIVSVQKLFFSAP